MSRADNASAGSPAGTDPEPFAIRSLVWTVYAPAFLLAFGQGLLIPVLPIFARDELLASDALVGLTVGARHIGTLAFDVPAGILVSRFGMWRTMIVGIIIFAVAALVAANSPNLGTLFVARLGAGASFAFWMISRHAYIANAVPPRNRGKALSLYGGIGRLAAIAGPTAGGIMAQYIDVAAPFYAQAVVALATAALVIVTMIRSGGETHLARPRTNILATLGGTLTHHRRDFMTAGLIAIVLQFVRAAREFLIPIWGDNIGLEKDEIGYVTSASYAIDSTMFPIVGFVMDRFGRKSVGVPSLLVMGAGLALLPLAETSAAFLVAASLLAGLGNGLSSGFVLTLGSDLAPLDNPGEFLGVWRFVSDVGHAGGPPFIGGVSQLLGLASASWVTGGIAAIGAVLLVIMVPETLADRERTRRR